ncbi:MAG: hypothetical protein ACRCY6_00655 [Bacteroidales bacterium]
MKKKLITSVLILLLGVSTYAQKDSFEYKFYGFIRGEIFYDSRANIEAFDGAFTIFPLDVSLDEQGNDLNDNPSTGFCLLATRVGLRVKGLPLLGAKTSANIEADFAGFGVSRMLFRLRHAEVKFAWSKTDLHVGQRWHPLFGEIAPRMMNISTGVPYQPFSRTPQIYVKQSLTKQLSVSAAGIYQVQFQSFGPDANNENVASLDFSRKAIVPEFFVGLNYKTDHTLISLGLDVTTIKPRIKSHKEIKVDEWLTTVSYMIGGEISKGLWKVNGKTVLGNNLSHTLMLGGYAVTAEDPISGEFSYTPFTHSSSWLGATFGKKYQVGIFAGYVKQLGANNEILNTEWIYGRGTDIDQLMNLNAQVSYNIDHFTVGFEYSWAQAFYGNLNLKSGKITDSHAVVNHRSMLMMTYFF